MNTSHHARRPLARAGLAVAAIAAALALCGAADLAARHYGVTAGAALIAGVFAACWIAARARPLLHPVSQRPREPQVTLPATLTEGQDPARIAA